MVSEAPHFMIDFQYSAKILKEVLFTAARLISFIRIRALKHHWNHKILARNGSTLQLTDFAEALWKHMIKLQAVFSFCGEERKAHCQNNLPSLNI